MKKQAQRSMAKRRVRNMHRKKVTTVAKKDSTQPPQKASGDLPVTDYRIQLTEVATRAVDLKTYRRHPEEFDTNYKYAIVKDGRRVSSTSFEALVEVRVVFQNPETRPFDISVAVAGTYTHLEGLPDGLLAYFVDVNGPLMLWPYVRELMSSLVTRAGYPPLILETLDVRRIQQQARLPQETRGSAGGSSR